MKKTDRELKQKLIASLEDQFYPAQKAVATQLANAVERAGLLTHGALSDITRPVFVPALAAEFTKEGAEELTQILRCAYREMPKNPAAKPNEVASGAHAGARVSCEAREKQGTGGSYENREQATGTNAPAEPHVRGHSTKTQAQKRGHCGSRAVGGFSR